jgi:hypothetical protein
MRSPSWYKVLENAREASLEVAAACAETYATLHPDGDCRPRGHDSGCDDDEDEPPRRRVANGRSRASSHCRDRGDFLSDLARLHINYLNQVAMLGSSYSGVVARGLEALYNRNVDCRPTRDCKPARHELELFGELEGYATGRISVRNERCEPANLDIDGLVDGELQLDFRQVGASSNVVRATVEVLTDIESAFVPCELDRGEKVWLLVRVDLEGFQQDRRYRASLPIRIGECSKSLRLIVRAVRP